MTLKTNKIHPRNGIVAGATGGILQVVSATKTDQHHINSGSLTQGTKYDITGLSAVITPTSTSSKILCMGHISHNIKGGTQGFFHLERNSSIVTGASGDADGARLRCMVTGQLGTGSGYSTWPVVTVPFSYVDSPASTSAQTYQVQVSDAVGGSYDIYINRSIRAYAGTYYDASCTSTLILMELSG